MGLKSPGPAELVRACQRDKEFIRRLKDDIDDMILEVFGQRVWRRFQEYSEHGCTIIYYALTNLMGYQTLGEEYVGVVQVNKSFQSVPSRKAISLMIFAQALGNPFINYVLKIIENAKQKQEESSTFPKYLNTFLTSALEGGRFYQQFLPLLSQLHLALFYVNGKFYHFSKRIAGIKYILVRDYFGNHDESSRANLKYLMWMSVINLAIVAVHDSYSYLSQQFIKKRETMNQDELSRVSVIKSGNYDQGSSTVSEVDPTKKCSLCLEVRRHSSVTPCGHLFCWDCIMDWLRSEGACPICRESVAPSRVVPLQNFE